MICGNCSAKIKENFKYCTSCGVKIEDFLSENENFSNLGKNKKESSVEQKIELSKRKNFLYFFVGAIILVIVYLVASKSVNFKKEKITNSMKSESKVSVMNEIQSNSNVPTCSISYSPDIIKVGEELTDSSMTTGVITKITMYSSKPQKGSLKNIESTSVANIGDPYFETYLGSNSGHFWPQRILGESTDTWIVEGPNGNSSCTRSFKMVPNDDWDTNASIIFPKPLSYHIIGSHLIGGTIVTAYSCPTRKCATKDWGGWEDSVDISISKKNNGYYYATTIGHFTAQNTTNRDSGWLLPEVIPKDIIEKLENQIK